MWELQYQVNQLLSFPKTRATRMEMVSFTARAKSSHKRVIHNVCGCPCPMSRQNYTGAVACATTPVCVFLILARYCYGVGVAVLVGVRETSMPFVWSPMTITRPFRKPRMVLA